MYGFVVYLIFSLDYYLFYLLKYFVRAHMYIRCNLQWKLKNIVSTYFDDDAKYTANSWNPTIFVQFSIG